MIIVTGGAGFIGSNIVKNLNKAGIKDITIVDDLTDGYKMRNLSDLDFVDYYDLEEFSKHDYRVNKINKYSLITFF